MRVTGPSLPFTSPEWHRQSGGSETRARPPSRPNDASGMGGDCKLSGSGLFGDGREAFGSAGIPARPLLLPPRLWSSARRFPSRLTQAHPSMTMFSNRGCATGLTWDVRARTPADRDGTDSCKTLPARAPALPGGPHQAPRRSPHFRSPSSPAGEWRLGDGREALWSAGIPARPCLLPPRPWSSSGRFPSRFTMAHPSMTMLPNQGWATGRALNLRARMPADRDGTQSCKTLPAGAPAIPGGPHHAPPGSPICLSRSPPAGEWRLDDGREPLWSAGIPARPCLLPPRPWSSSGRFPSRFTMAHPSMTMLPIRWCATGLTWDVRARMPADRDGTQCCKTPPAMTERFKGR